MGVIEYAGSVKERISCMKVFDEQGQILPTDAALDVIISDLILLRRGKGKVMFIGNGGSAAIASHMAVDFWKNAKVRAVSFNDPSQITCLSNDNGYENVFSLPVDAFAEEGDILVAISSSGSSSNILNAAASARKRKCRIFTLSGFKEDNPLRKKGDINIYVGDMSYGIVETAHAMVCHYFLDSVLKRQRDV
jgi:D-sedoheptulose 7-phosphate isomerase